MCVISYGALQLNPPPRPSPPPRTTQIYQHLYKKIAYKLKEAHWFSIVVGMTQWLHIVDPLPNSLQVDQCWLGKYWATQPKSSCFDWVIGSRANLGGVLVRRSLKVQKLRGAPICICLRILKRKKINNATFQVKTQVSKALRVGGKRPLHLFFDYLFPYIISIFLCYKRDIEGYQYFFFHSN